MHAAELTHCFGWGIREYLFSSTSMFLPTASTSWK